MVFEQSLISIVFFEIELIISKECCGDAEVFSISTYSVTIGTFILVVTSKLDEFGEIFQSLSVLRRLES